MPKQPKAMSLDELDRILKFAQHGYTANPVDSDWQPKIRDEAKQALLKWADEQRVELTAILDKYNVPEYSPNPINKSRYGLMCNELRKTLTDEEKP